MRVLYLYFDLCVCYFVFTVLLFCLWLFGLGYCVGGDTAALLVFWIRGSLVLFDFDWLIVDEVVGFSGFTC